jgi:DNA-directed RNA polymerase subunit RPC12/RpoP
MRRCTSCSSENRETARFCAKCGKRLVVPASSASTVRTSEVGGLPATVQPSAPANQPTPRDVIFRCSHCSKSLAIAETAVGRTYACTDCHLPVVVPEPEAQFNCPGCSRQLCAPGEVFGTNVRCPECQVEFLVPVVMSAEPPLQ